MEPVLLVHGYSAESKENDPASVSEIFGTLPTDLKNKLAGVTKVLDVNVSRYVSLDDGVDLDDITLAFDRALKKDFPDLLRNGFNAIIHSTGALVLRNWVRRCCPLGGPSPCRRIIHLAGANLGSGWAHIGETLLAKWLRYIGEGGAERGLAVLDGLELGSNWAWDLHHFFLQPEQAMLADYEVMEFSLVGSQPPPKNLLVPFRYGKEDGSDGVVRVSASNLNHHYLRLGPVMAPEDVDWDEAKDFAERTVEASVKGDLADFAPGAAFAGDYYDLLESSLPGKDSRPTVPFAIPYCCAHSTEEMGIVSGTQNRAEVLDLVEQALRCPDAAAYPGLVDTFAQYTQSTYRQVADANHASGLRGLLGGVTQTVLSYLTNPEAQYDRHAQISVRVRDQHGKPIPNCSIHFNSLGGDQEPHVLINSLFEDSHQNKSSPDTTTFYLRLQAWDKTRKDWVDRLAQVNGVDLEIDSVDPRTQQIVFVPLRMRLSAERLADFLQPHRATLLDVVLLRLPALETFSIYPHA